MGLVKLNLLNEWDGQSLSDIEEVGPVDWAVEQWNEGLAGLFAVMHDGKRVGTTLLASEQTPEDKKLLVCRGAKIAGVGKLLDDFLSCLEDYARENAYDSVNFKTRRYGLARKIVNRAPSAELTLEWDVD